MTIRLGTRPSALAMRQANLVRERLERLRIAVELLPIKTTGDQVLDRPLAAVGGKALFLKEIEEALLAGHIDLAVHSLKDVPWEIPAGLKLEAFLEREDPRDALVTRDQTSLAMLKSGARVGTTSLRRICQLRAQRPDLLIDPLRGNVDTRLRKVGRGDVDAAVLAMAGLKRLGLESHVAEVLDSKRFVPAAGQGVIVIEVRQQDAGLCAALDHVPTQIRARAERAVLEGLGGDCHVPVAAFAELVGGQIHLDALVGEPDGSLIVRDQVRGSLDDPRDLGLDLAKRLLEKGAGEILQRLGSTL